MSAADGLLAMHAAWRASIDADVQALTATNPSFRSRSSTG